MPIRFQIGGETNKENRVSNNSSKGSEASASVSPTRDDGYRFDHDKDNPQAWAERFEQGQTCETEHFLDTALSEFKEQAIRIVAQTKVGGHGSIKGDVRIEEIDKFLQGPAVRQFKDRLREQFQELEHQNYVRKLGDGRGHVKRKDLENRRRGNG